MVNKTDLAITRWTPTGQGGRMVHDPHKGHWIYRQDAVDKIADLRERLRIAEDTLTKNGTMIEGDYAHLILREADVEILRTAILKHAGLFGLSEVLRVALSKVDPR